MEQVHVEIQYIDDCPNTAPLIERTRQAILKVKRNVDLKLIHIRDNDTARELHFRGSPTLLINGEDYWGMELPEQPALACRFFPDGLPSVGQIRQRLIDIP
ncbi:MAG: DsbA family protein [bacterium]